jgi:hypothetical protein
MEYPGGRHHAHARSAFRLGVEATILIAAYIAYEFVRRIVAPNSNEAFAHAGRIIEFEQRLGIFYEPQLQALVLDHGWLVTLFNWVYVWGYLPVICVAAFYLYLRHHALYTRYRNAFLLSGAVGLVIFATLPVAPPRMFPEFGFVDTVRDNSAIYAHLDNSEVLNEFAAVPSFHFGWILLVALAVYQTSRSVAARVLCWSLPLMMLLAIVFTANHYVIDAIIGGAVVLLALAVVRAGEWIMSPQTRARWRAFPRGWHSSAG